jgi:hypothetical protein
MQESKGICFKMLIGRQKKRGIWMVFALKRFHIAVVILDVFTVLLQYSNT